MIALSQGGGMVASCLHTLSFVKVFWNSYFKTGPICPLITRYLRRCRYLLLDIHCDNSINKRTFKFPCSYGNSLSRTWADRLLCTGQSHITYWIVLRWFGLVSNCAHFDKILLRATPSLLLLFTPPPFTCAMMQTFATFRREMPPTGQNRQVPE